MAQEIILLLLLGVFIGCVAGFTGGLFGMGGGVVLVPTLLGVFHFLGSDPTTSMKQAVATSLLLVIPAGVGAVRKQWSLHNLDLQFCKRWVPYVAIGAFFGVLLSLVFSGGALKITFLVYLLLCIVILLVLKEKKGLGQGRPHGWVRRSGGLFIGAFSVMLGIGGGTLTVPFLKLNKCPIRQALGLSSATTIGVGLIGSLGMIVIGLGHENLAAYSLGFVNLPAAAVIAPFMFWLSPHGVSCAHKVSRRWLNLLYIIFLAVVFGYMLWHTISMH